MNPFMKQFRYRWVHLPSGKSDVSEWEGFSRDEFLSRLADWNEDQPGVWEYSEDPQTSKPSNPERER